MSPDCFLESVVAPSRPVIAERVVVVVAHPDDETLGCGALLGRMAALTVVHVTDGAPANGADAARHGFSDSRAYGLARCRELGAAVVAGGAGAARLICLDVPDQGVIDALASIAQRLEPILAGTDIVLTHAYEGGHPDHDGTAFAVHAAVRRLGPAKAPGIVEMPFYRAEPDGRSWARQRFGPGAPALTLHLSAEESRRKRAMLAAHLTQADTLGPFGAADEAFRPADTTDFTRPPTGGPVLYESFDWGIDATTFCHQARIALGELGLDATA